MIEWFIDIENKESSSFIVFDIESFYPSISEDLFKNATQYAKKPIDHFDYNLLLKSQARTMLLFHKNAPWVKKENNGDFDVPMACFDGAEVLELVGTYILNQLKDIFEQHSVGVYRDDDLAVVKGLSGSEIERIKKGIVKVFKDCGLKISIKGELKIVNFLDVTFNLHKNTYEPYRKSDKESVYINLN